MQKHPMPKTYGELKNDITACIRRSYEQTGYGAFALEIKRVNGQGQIVLATSPSHRYAVDDQFLALEASTERGNSPFRSLAAVSEHVMDLIKKILNKSNGHGEIRVRVRARKTEKIEIQINHEVRELIVLRPAELT